MIPDINTKMITLIGKPLGFSVAARMQNRAYEAAGINMIYFYSEAENAELPHIINGIRYMNFAGCAVTKPNKVEVLKYLDELDPLCEKMGASNTVVKLPDGKLKGYNTDGMGAYRSLVEEGGIKPDQCTFFCFGAGGSGRAVAYTLAFHGAKKIYINSRRPETSQNLVKEMNEKFGRDVAEFVLTADEKAMREAVAKCDVLLNNSGLGMIGHEDETPIPADALKPNQLCWDATYNPAKTRFLADAEKIGCKIINGIGMNIYQGAEQIKLWTGKDAPIDAMKHEFDLIQAEKK